MKLFKLVKVAFVLTMLFQNQAQGVELPTPNNFGGDFTMSSTLGRDVALNEFRGKVVLLNFGFTSCPDVCPMVLSKLSLVQSLFDKKANKIQVVFVTVDPERDTFEKLELYLKHYHESFIGLRSSDENEIRAIMKKYGAALEAVMEGKQKSISHSDYVYVINQKGYVAGFYDVKSNIKELISSVEKLL